MQATWVDILSRRQYSFCIYLLGTCSNGPLREEQATKPLALVNSSADLRIQSNCSQVSYFRAASEKALVPVQRVGSIVGENPSV